MRIFSILLLFVSFSMTSAYSQDAKQDEHTDPDPKTFKEAYAGYNKSVENRLNVKKLAKRSDVKNLDHHVTYYAQKAYELGVEKYGEEHINSVNLAINWIDAYTNHSHKHGSPIKTLNRVFRGFEKTASNNPQKLIEFNIAFGILIVKQENRSDKQKSLRFFKKATKLAKDTYPADSLELAKVLLNIGTSLYSNLNVSETTKYIKSARDIYSKVPEDHKGKLALANFWLAKSYLSSKKYKDAARNMSAALKIFDEYAPSGQYSLSGHAFMVSILEKQGKSEEATLHCQKIGQAKPIDVDQEQIPLYKAPGKYPRRAAEKGREGNVLIEFTVDNQGFVQNPIAIGGENVRMFSASALESIKDFRFAPRFENGNPVSTDDLKFNFEYRMAK